MYRVKQKLWGGAFSKGPDELAWSFGQSIDSDVALWRQEIHVSIVHAQMLGGRGIIPTPDAQAIVDGLRAIEEEADEKGVSVFPADSEDIHAAIEGLLKQRIGDAADKLHAGRSRNDQIATVTRVWLRTACDGVVANILVLQKQLIDLGEKHKGDPMPGFTHMQSAQPVTLGFHLMAYFWMLQRDVVRLRQVVLNANKSPLGSAALAGTSLPIDRMGTAMALGFEGPMENALDATSDRDFVGDALHACVTLMQHLSRLSQELALWSTPAYGFVKLGEEFTTGSSIMPQKRNPDMAELIRGRSARVIGHWTAFMSMMKALPLGYNRDQQEDKPPLFDSVQLCAESLQLSIGMLRTASFNTERMAAVAGDGFAAATGVAEAMVKEGMAFRSAHEATGKLVRKCEERGITLSDLTPEDLDGLPPSILKATSVQASIASRNSYGGPALEAMDQQVAEAKALLANRAQQQ
ncbi:MAG TPA: argininosuccinate lyase [Fimbriimonadaceae bacterium]|nr:argininosuccinate lyase [Fimbriimonadaceae bacterium]